MSTRRTRRRCRANKLYSYRASHDVTSSPFSVMFMLMILVLTTSTNVVLLPSTTIMVLAERPIRNNAAFLNRASYGTTTATAKPTGRSSRFASASEQQQQEEVVVDYDSTGDDATTQQQQEGTEKAYDSRREITVQTSLKVPFSAQIAFDNFADLPKQADYSPWLRKVEYLTPPAASNQQPDATSTTTKTISMPGRHWGGETKWTMGFRGVSYKWNAVCTTLDRPHVLEWQSTTGLQNFGKVVFEEVKNNKNENDTAIASPTTQVTMTMTFVAPRLVASLFQRSTSLANFVQNRMLATTLINFRDIVMANLAKEQEEEKQQRQEQQGSHETP